jgi:hypothetical protein
MRSQESMSERFHREKMAYDAEASFKRSSAIFDAEKFVVERLGSL